MIALREGRKIEAIKEVRALIGCGLKEAKDLVEPTIDGLRSNLPIPREAGVFFVLNGHTDRFCDITDAIEHAKNRGRPSYIARAEKRVKIGVQIEDVF